MNGWQVKIRDLKMVREIEKLREVLEREGFEMEEPSLWLHSSGEWYSEPPIPGYWVFPSAHVGRTINFFIPEKYSRETGCWTDPISGFVVFVVGTIFRGFTEVMPEKMEVQGSRNPEVIKLLNSPPFECRTVSFRVANRLEFYAIPEKIWDLVELPLRKGYPEMVRWLTEDCFRLSERATSGSEWVKIEKT